MARETGAAVAPADQHLLPDFDASSEKVAVLRGHLLEHNVPFNSSAKKAELVKLFNTRIKPRAAELLAQRQAVESSSHGIERVITSKKSKGKGKRVREPESEEDELASSSAVSSSQASSEPEQSSELHKATPGRKRKVTAEAEPQVLNDSEEERRNTPARTLKKEKTASASPSRSQIVRHGPQAESGSPRKKPRRTYGGEGSLAVVDPTPDKRRKSDLVSMRDSPSGFSDYNPFQSGGDRPEMKKKKRKSSMGTVQAESPRQMNTPLRVMPPVKMEQLPSPSLDAAFVAPEQAQADARMRLEELRHQQHLEEQKAAEAAQALERQRRPPQQPTQPSASRRSLKPGRKSLSSIIKEAEMQEAALKSAADDIEQEMEDVGQPPTFEPVVEVSPQPEHAYEHHMSSPKPTSSKKKAPRPSQIPKRKSQVFPPPPQQFMDDPEPAPRYPQTLGATPNKRPPVRATSFPAVARRTPLVVHHRKGSKSALTQALLSGALLVCAIGYFVFWRHERLALGYCDTTTNPQSAFDETGRTIDVASANVPVLSRALDVVRPSCMPCPTHATCAFGKLITCDTDYVRRPNPWSSSILPLSDRCLPDTEKLSRILKLAAQAASALRQKHGDALCAHVSAQYTVEHDMAKVGVRQDDLAKQLIPDAGTIPSEQFPRYFAQAVDDLQQSGEVVRQVDTHGATWIASMAADMSMSCRLRRSAYAAAARHKVLILEVLGTLFLLWWLRTWYRQTQGEKSRVRDLVNVALRLLRDQKLRHLLAKDEGKSVSDVPPYWGQEQMRDQLLSSEHSLSTRQRVWSKVAKIVESNDNIGLKQAVHRGQPLSVWEWTGNTDSRLDIDGSPRKVEVESMYPSLE